ncbi:hypothetical protein [Candidatus Cryosericum septentrionale]|jgi:hypothetical protein|uniref:Uncharacterized protein n=1 Tax=Candidatus Cryosericum septentrionale TaxID=2290913 RepID=A0A398DR19_9BACT|nr:hypothetical protein [Candidatus Cryosericum septentrionale]RIE17705.1 hypothetical protein SMC1_00535 [Candidatus Cryosericum septentrionale]
MPMYKVSKAETPKSFDKKDGSGSGQMQKIVLKSDDDQKEYKCTIFSPDEVFIGDIVEATMKGYKEKFKEYQFTVKTVTPGPREIPNTPKEPKVSVEGEKGGSNSRSPEDTLKIVRQATLKVVGGLFQGKGDIENVGTYLALADEMTEWCMTGTVTPRITKEERENLVTQFGSVEGARLVAMNAFSIPFLHLLTQKEYETLVGGPTRTSPLV